MPRIARIQRRRKTVATIVAMAIVAVSSLAVLMFNSSSVDAASSVGNDPVGDAVSETGSTPPGYLDMKKVKISEKKSSGNFEFTCSVASRVPSGFGPDDDITLCGISLNLAPANGAPAEYVVIVRWRDAFEGVLIDYTNGFPPTSTPIAFEISGKKIKATIPSELLGNPDTLTWIALSREKDFVRTNGLEGVTDAVPNDVLELPWVPGDDQFPENLGVWTADRSNHNDDDD